MKAFTSVLNYRIGIILLETLLVKKIYDYYQIHLEIDFTILSIAIIFPLVFSITSAYQRRQDAIQHYTSFRNKIIDLSNLFYAVDLTSKKDYQELFHLLEEVQQKFNQHLINDYTEGNDNRIVAIREQRKQVFKFINSHTKKFNEREKDSIIRVKNELFYNIELLNGLKIHGTPVSLRKYCLIFIYLSPFLYNSQILFDNPASSFIYTDYLAIGFALVISFILMALYNVQQYIENPFDQKGLDDLKIEHLKVISNEDLYH